MNKLYITLFVLIVLSCSKKSETATEQLITKPLISKSISSEEFHKKILSTHNAIILDVRTPEELVGGYIDGAININFSASDFETKISKLDRDATYFVYCAGGGRSKSAMDQMEDLQFKEVYNLAGGITNWSAKGFPVKQP